MPWTCPSSLMAEGMLIRICACPTSGKDRGVELPGEPESLLDGLQWIESELGALRE